MNKRILMIISVFLVMTCIFLFFITHFFNSTLIAQDGYFVSGNTIDKNLLSDKKNVKQKNVELSKISDEDNIYQNLGKIFVDNNKQKTEVNVQYPIFVNNGLGIVNLNANNKLINKKFELFDSYENFTLTDGKLYNYGDNDQSDYETYIFLQLENGSYINLCELSFPMSYKGKTIPVNSIINFQEEYIKYYYYNKNGKLVLDIIENVELYDDIKVGKKTYSYEDFLALMNLRAKSEEEEEEEILEPEEEEEYIIEIGDYKPSDSSEEKEQKYVKPKVSVEDFNINIYSGASKLYISDPARVIIGGINFQLFIGEKLYARKIFVSSGKIQIIGLIPNTTFKIVGSYRFYNEEHKKMEATFFEQTFTTGDYKTLDPIELGFDLGDIYPNKIELKDLKITSDIKSEAVKGLAKGSILINGEKYSISMNVLNTLFKGESCNYESPTSLKSNKKQDFEILFYDSFGNQLNISKNTGTTRTAKAPPTANFKVTSSEVNYVDFDISLKNPDDVNISNYKYAIYNNENVILSEGNLDASKSIESFRNSTLDPNLTYYVRITGDYDLLDGKGTVSNAVLGEGKFTTLPLSSLGYIRVITGISDITSNSAQFTTDLDIDNISSILLELMVSFKIEVCDESNNVVYSKNYTGAALDNFVSDQQLFSEILGLASVTNYSINYTAIVKQGNSSEKINVISAIKGFKTHKRDARVDIQNRFVNNNMIDFDVRIVDADLAIEGDRVLLEVRDPYDKLIAMESLDINGAFVQLSYTKLEPNMNYSFKYYAEQYNVGYDNSTYENDYVLKNELINTEDGISGSIELQDMTRQITGDNLFNIRDYDRMRIEGNTGYKKYDLDNNAVMFGGKNGYVNFSYYIPEAYHRVVYVKFKAKYDSKSEFRAPAYLSRSYGNTQSYLLENLSTEYKEYTFSFPMNTNYIGFLINAPSSRNERTNVWFKDINIYCTDRSDEAMDNISVTYHESGYRFSNTIMLAGDEMMPSYHINGEEIGNYGDGYAKITNLSTNEETIFEYTGDSQTFRAQTSGAYRIELWGAGGGDGSLTSGQRQDVTSHGGRGAYTKGDIQLSAGTKLYVYVGGKGLYGSQSPTKNAYKGPIGGYNGGGAGGNASSGSGGGATDVRVVSGAWNNESSLKSRIMVAAGGGGADDYGSTAPGTSNDGSGGAGGALVSKGAYINGVLTPDYYATQVYGNAFGIGANVTTNTDTGGAGGGYYGGMVSNNSNGGGSGGSSYISGHKGCVAYDKAFRTPSGNSEYTEKDNYLASFKVDLNDRKHEISDNSYYIRIYLDGEEIANSPYQYGLINYQVLSEIKQFNLKKNKKYSIKLSVKVRERFYDIDSIDITTNSEIRAISTVDEFFAIHTSGKYVVVADLDFTKINKSITNFYGEIDFQGHTVTLNWNGRGNLFEYTRGGSSLKNIVLNVSLDNTSAKTWNSPFVRYHYGTIDNVQVNIVNSYDTSNYADGVLTYANYSIIKNFVIHNKVEVYVQSRFGLVTYSNQGLIKNGYIYGENINAMRQVQNASKDTGAIACEATTNSRIQNVFSLIGVTKDPTMASENYAGNLIGYANVGKMENSFSVEADDTSTNLPTQDPNFGRINSMVAKNVFYASKKSYNSKLSSKMSFLALYDTNFLDNILNKEKVFNIDTYVELGYYPQLKMNDCMPNLEWIPLPSIQDEDLIDVTSVEEVSNDGSSAVIKLFLNNPAGEEIESVGIQDIQTVEIISQENKNGKTVLTVRMSNPLAYKSKYYLRKICSRGVHGSYDTNFNQYDRPLDIVLYYPISTVDDWMQMNVEPTDNYILTNDLDFSGVPDSKIYISKYFEGILNGNGHTIKNITISSKNGVFERLINNSMIKNLYIDHYKKTSNTSYGGFVYVTTGSPTFDNVHIIDSSVKATTYLGSLVGNGSGIIMINCSSTRFKSVTNPEVSDIRIGGLVGYLTGNGYISNSFVQDVDISILDSISTYGIGGIVGQMANGSITNVYATGSIKSNSVYVGGIAGYSNTIISNCWSNVNIYTELDYVGGIIGKRENATIASTLTLGAIYSNYPGQNINRTSGNTLLQSQKNYFWSEQPFYGYVVGDTTAEKPLTTEQLKNVDTYHDLFEFGEDFDYSQVSEGILPKLNSTSGDLLPNQEDNKYESDLFNIQGFIQTTQRVEDGDVYFVLDNPNNYEVTTVTFDYLKYDESNIRITNTGEGYTIVNISNIKPTRYYDIYTLTGVSYKESANASPKTIYKYVQVDLQFYKTLSSYTDWRLISTSTTENYRLSGDLDFAGVTNVNTNVSIGRLEGQGSGYAIKNLTITDIKTTFSLIRKITTSLKNVRFENITLKVAAGKTYGSYCNIIRLNFADIDNVTFDHITIDAPGVTNYVAPIAINRGQSLRNITIKNNNITGKNYVGGLLAASQNLDAYMVKAEHITVYGNGSYVGGIVGQRDYANPTRWFYFSGDDMTVTGKSHTGGLFGYAGANYSSIKNSTIRGLSGAERVGGIAGSNLDRYANYYDAENINVISEDGVTYTGGLFGWSYDSSYTYIKDSRIVVNGTGTVYAGGIQGYKNGYTNSYAGVNNCTIISSGLGGTGGLVGYSTGSGVSNYNYVYNTRINGVNNVGGAIGNGRNSRLYYTTINVKIDASGSNVGGVYGYINNIDATDSTYSDVVHEIILENSEITGGNNVALFAGYATGNVLFDNFFYNIYLAGKITTEGNKYGIVLPQTSTGSLELSSLLPRFYVYTNNTINDTNIKDLNFLSDTISNLKLITATDLATQSYYTSHGITTSYFQFTDYDGTNLINRGYYPFVKTATGQVPVKLPTAAVSFSTQGSRKKYQELPTLDVYSSGIHTINLEFNKLETSTKMTVYEDEKEVFDDYLSQRVYTFNYNYKSPIKILLDDGTNKKLYTYDAKDLQNPVTTFKNSYAYLYNGELKGNIKTTNDTYIHIYDKYALTDKGSIYDLEKGKFESKNSDYSLTNTNKATSLFEFKIDNSTIETYAKYSIIHKDNGEIYYENQIFDNNGTLEIIDSSLENKKNSIIIDSSGTKKYITVLGNDGVLYNIKDAIKLPSNFNNSNIKYMSHNINNDSNLAVIMYETGRVVVFDYRTGNQIIAEKATENISIFEYIQNTSSFKKSIIDENPLDTYEESIALQKQIENHPLYEDGDGNYFYGDKDKKSSDYSLNSKYVTYYNVTKNSYDVVDIGDVILGDQDEVMSENDKIYTSDSLMRFYMTQNTYQKVKSNINVIYLLITVLLGILVALVLWFKNARDLKGDQYEKNKSKI